RGIIFWYTKNGYTRWRISAEGKEYDLGAEHRILMEKYLGRVLFDNETIHHKNGKRSDNRIENLEFRIGSHGPGATHCPNCGYYFSNDFDHHSNNNGTRSVLGALS